MFDDESMLRAIYAFYQIYLCLLANVFLLSIKCTFVYYQIYSFFMMKSSYIRQPLFDFHNLAPPCCRA